MLDGFVPCYGETHVGYVWRGSTLEGGELRWRVNAFVNDRGRVPPCGYLVQPYLSAGGSTSPVKGRWAALDVPCSFRGSTFGLPTTQTYSVCNQQRLSR